MTGRSRVLLASVAGAIALGVLAVNVVADDKCEPVTQALVKQPNVTGPGTAEEALSDFLGGPEAGDGPAADLNTTDFAVVDQTTKRTVFRAEDADVEIVLDYVTPNLDTFGWYVSDVSSTC